MAGPAAGPEGQQTWVRAEPRAGALLRSCQGRGKSHFAEGGDLSSEWLNRDGNSAVSSKAPRTCDLSAEGESPTRSSAKHSPWSLKRRCLGLAETLRCTLWEGDGALLLVRSAEGRGFKVMASPSSCKNRKGRAEVRQKCLWMTALPDTNPPRAHMRHRPWKTNVQLNPHGDTCVSTQTLTNSQSRSTSHKDPVLREGCTLPEERTSGRRHPTPHAS